MDREVSFWVAVGLVSIVSVVVFKLAGAAFGERFPALARLAGVI